MTDVLHAVRRANPVVASSLDDVVASRSDDLLAQLRNGDIATTLSFKLESPMPRRAFIVPIKPRFVAAFGLLVVVAALATPAFGVVGRIRDLFQGTPPTPAVVRDFQIWNDLSGWQPTTGDAQPSPPAAAQGKLASTFPTVDPSHAHGLLEVQFAEGPVYLWAAPLAGGGECAVLESTDTQGNELGNSWGSGESWCVSPNPSSTPRTFGQYGRPTNHNQRVLPGKAPGAASVIIQFADGTETHAPVVEGFFLVPVNGAPQSPETTVAKITSYDDGGNELAQMTPP
jgi:hypothetical protein